MIKARCDRDDWVKFKEFFYPLPAAQALGLMIRLAVRSKDQPFASIMEEVFTAYINLPPRDHSPS